ncbi:MAG: 50S ribosomal protein L4 [Deltaproteobacteria bacterium]|nr:50S ribosomal protein L4 [Deltaproteobacteria bacterium]
MPVLDVLDITRAKVGQVEVSPGIFEAEVKRHLLHEVVRMQLASRRAGTHDTKTRAEVSGGGRKPWRQKGTGRARAGSIRSPLWRGGGIIFGPHPRDHGFSVPKKVRRAALRVALTQKLQEGRLLVVRDLRVPDGKTKGFVAVMRGLGVSNGLVVTAAPDTALERAARNVPRVKVLRAEGLNVYDVLRHEHLVLTEPSLEQIQGALEP